MVLQVSTVKVWRNTGIVIKKVYDEVVCFFILQSVLHNPGVKLECRFFHDQDFTRKNMQKYLGRGMMLRELHRAKVSIYEKDETGCDRCDALSL